MTPVTRRRVRATAAALLVAVGGLGFLAWFAWAYTDPTNWGSWSKGPLTTSAHFHKASRFLLVYYWPEVLAFVAMVVSGLWLWRRRMPRP